MEKKCTKCGEVKCLEEFGKRATSKDGKQSRCKLCRNAANREYRKSDVGKASMARYLATDKGQEWSSRSREGVRGDRTEYVAEYYQKNKARLSVIQSEWRRSNNGVNSRRLARAKRRSLETDAPSDNWKATEVHHEAGGRCLYCGIEVELHKMHADHFIPLAKGGSNLRENIVCSCASCNLSKAAKLPEDFIGRTL